MSTLRKEIVSNELYLYNAKGELIFKRWIKQGYSMVMDLMPYTKHTFTSITEEDGKITFKHNGRA
mgnify:CR=1 FL=1